MADPVQRGLPPQLLLALRGDNEQTLDQFVCSDSLKAYTRALADGQSDDWVLADGAAGQGKSHWLMALSHRAGPRSGYVGAQALLAAGPKGLAQLDGLELICVDDIHLMLNDPAQASAWQEAWFHQINRWRDGGCQLVAASQLRPAALELSLADLESRLSMMTRVQLKPLESGEREVLLNRRARARGIDLPAPLVDYLLNRHARSAADLIAVLDQLSEASLKAQRKLTVPFARQVLGGV